MKETLFALANLASVGGDYTAATFAEHNFLDAIAHIGLHGSDVIQLEATVVLINLFSSADDDNLLRLFKAGALQVLTGHVSIGFPYLPQVLLCFAKLFERSLCKHWEGVLCSFHEMNGAAKLFEVMTNASDDDIRDTVGRLLYVFGMAEIDEA